MTNKTTLNQENRFLLDKELRKLTDGELYILVNSNDQDCDEVLCHLYKMFDEPGQKFFIKILQQEFKQRGLDHLDIKPNLKESEELEEEFIEPEPELNIDTNTSLIETIKSSNINNISFFAKSKLLNDISEKIGISREFIEFNLDKPQIINENVVINNSIYNKLQDAISVIQPVRKPELRLEMSESQLWLEIRDNEDWLLESKIKSYLSAQKNKYKTLSIAEKSIKKETYIDPIHELNKVQKQILKDTKKYNNKELTQLSVLMDEGLEKYNLLSELFDTTPPQDNSILSRFIRANVLLDNEEVKELQEKVQEYLEKNARGTGKKVEFTSFFDYKSVIKNDIKESLNKNVQPQLDWLKDYSIILKESDKFYFNIVSKVFVQELEQTNEELRKELDETYLQDLTKSKKTLERKYHSKKFKSIPVDDQESVKHLDTNGWRIHLYQDPSTETNIDYNIEYYPSNYKKSDLTETEQFYENLKESKTAKKLEKYLLNGEHILIPDTGVVLWYSLSDKTWMIDMKPVTFKELFNLYKQENKRHHGEL